MMLNFLRFLAAHGIDPEVPLVLGGVLMGICLLFLLVTFGWQIL